MKAEDLLEAPDIDTSKILKPFKITVLYNIAYLNQKIGRLEECGKYLERVIHVLEEFTEHTDVRKQRFLEDRPFIGEPYEEQLKKCRTSITAYLNDGLMKFRYLTKFHLQWCAVLSQLA